MLSISSYSRLLSPPLRHWANMEYGCSAELNKISLVQWNHDEECGAPPPAGNAPCLPCVLRALAWEIPADAPLPPRPPLCSYGGFGGRHAMITGGYSQITDAMAQGLGVRLGMPVSRVEW